MILVCVTGVVFDGYGFDVRFFTSFAGCTVIRPFEIPVTPCADGCDGVILNGRMSITIPLPDELERKLRAGTPDLDLDAKEAFLVSLYRRGMLYHKDLAGLLGLDRWQAETVLRRHGVCDLTPEEIDRQFETIRQLGV